VNPRGWRGAAAAASILLLVGCAPKPLPPGPTAADIERYYGRAADDLWESFDLPDDVVRPVVPRAGAVPGLEWVPTVVTCMRDAGYDNYSSEGGGLVSTGTADGPPLGERLALYTCQTRFPYAAEPEQLFTVAQRDYIYDYYVEFLVPCLEFRGNTVAEAPSRADFLSRSGFWSPYYEIGLGETSVVLTADDIDSAVELRASLEAECPSLPVGLRE
jgi:hypothetical protein